MANMIRRPDPFEMMREVLSWDPFRQLAPMARGSEAAMPQFMPTFDVKETRDALIFKADMPGVEEKDLDVTLTGNRLTVTGRREAEKRDEGERWFAYERSYGSFTRTFTLPDDIDGENIGAELKNGVLTLSIPKRPEAKPKKISFKGLGDKVKGVLGKETEKGNA